MQLNHGLNDFKDFYVKFNEFFFNYFLGAEKALFRALKKKGNTPKYGLIFHSSFIGRAAAKNKGKFYFS